MGLVSSTTGHMYLQIYPSSHAGYHRSYRVGVSRIDLEMWRSSSSEETCEKESNCILPRFRVRNRVPFDMQHTLSNLSADGVDCLRVNWMASYIRDVECVPGFPTLCGDLCSFDTQTVFPKYPCDIGQKPDSVLSA